MAWLTAGSIADNSVERIKLTTETLVAYPIPLSQCKAGGAGSTGNILDCNGIANSYRIMVGAYGTGGAFLRSADFAGGTTVTATLLTEFALPAEYVAGTDFEVVVNAGLWDDGLGAALGTCTVDVQAYKLDDEGSPGSDINTDAAQNITLTATNYSFTISGTGLVAGDRLEIFVQQSIQETGAPPEDLYGELGSLEAQLNIKG